MECSRLILFTSHHIYTQTKEEEIERLKETAAKTTNVFFEERHKDIQPIAPSSDPDITGTRPMRPG